MYVLIDTEGRTSASHVHFTVTKNNGKTYGWQLSIWMLITNHQHNTRKHTNKTLCQKSWKTVHGRTKAKPKRRKKTKIKNTKKENNPLTKRLQKGNSLQTIRVLFGFLKDCFGWPGYVDRNPLCLTSWNHELCPTPKKNHHSTEITRSYILYHF